jgi:hypothetical protein
MEGTNQERTVVFIPDKAPLVTPPRKFSTGLTFATEFL